MSLNIERVWQKTEDGEVLVPISDIKEGYLVSVRVGSVIPLDGIVDSGEAMVNQASMTGESEPVRKENGMYVYAEPRSRKETSSSASRKQLDPQDSSAL